MLSLIKLILFHYIIPTLRKTCTVVSKIMEISPIGSFVKQSCNIERCGNKMHQIVANMMLSQYLELKLLLL